MYTIDNNIPKRLTDINPGTGSSVEAYAKGKGLGFLHNAIYFSANNGTSGIELCKYDIGSGVATMIQDINPGGHASPQFITEYAGKLYFAANDGTNGNELWCYTGWAPKMVANINPGSANSDPAHLIVWDGNLYFSAKDPALGIELFKLNDTTSSVQNVAFKGEVAVYPNPASSTVYMNVQLPGEETMSVQLSDAAGKNIFSTGMVNYKPGSHKITIPISTLPAGTYFYNVTSGTGTNYIAGSILKQ